MGIIARPLGEILQGIRINSKESLFKMMAIIDIYNNPCSSGVLNMYFKNPPAENNKITIEILIAVIAVTSEGSLEWSDKYTELFTFKYDSIEND